MADLQGRVVLVTGGGRGLGAATCDVLSTAGATIAIADLQADGAKSVVERLQKRGATAAAMTIDISRPEDCEEIVRRVASQFGRIDVLINNAATDMTTDIEQLAVADWDRVMRVNLHGPFYLAKQVFPLMRKQGGGQIVNMTSTAAKRTWANASAYHASKWGLLGLSHALHVEGRPHGIKVTAVVSGGMRTPFLLDRFPDIDEGLLQDPRNVAETIRFVLTQPKETVIPEIMVLPMRESSWP